MGCDIHLVLEKRVQIPDTETVCWIGVNAFPYTHGTIYSFGKRDGNNDGPSVTEGRISWTATDRNYELFAHLAGVRGPGPDPKGMPDDASVMALCEVASWGVDGHSHTWWTLDEALPMFIGAGQFGDPGQAVKVAMKEGTPGVLVAYAQHFWPVEDDENLADYRLIIWFDN